MADPVSSAMAADLRLALDAQAFGLAAGLDGPLDQWSSSVLDPVEAKLILNCARQAGKSTIAALLACRTAIFEPSSLLLCVSPSLRQSGKLFRRVLAFYHGLGDALPSKPKVKAESVLRLELTNGSRVVSLPGSEKTTRGYSKATLIILDEASRIDDALISSLRPDAGNGQGQALHCYVDALGPSWFFLRSLAEPRSGLAQDPGDGRSMPADQRLVS